MYENNDIEIWNIDTKTPCFVGAQKIFNIIGRLKKSDTIKKLFYALNKNPEKPVFFNKSNRPKRRLEKPGDFNIDTIEVTDLKKHNVLYLKLVDKN
ncbi:MAG: hypothetical protein F6K24_28175, partial [Okeania sp. SIO2D1]|nr:hypothetical protein [Okeania sp. SIO2D1]